MPVPSRIFLSLTDKDSYQCCLLRNGYLQFTVKALYFTDVNIGLFVEDDMSQVKTTGEPEYVINLASQGVDSKIELCKRSIVGCVQRIPSPFVLIVNEWRGFWVSISNGCITFGKENESEPIINWNDINLKPVVKLGFQVNSYDEPDSEDEGCIEEAEVAIDIATKPPSTSVSWIKCSHGQLPDNAIVGGDHAGDAVYVIRSMIHNALTPGQLIHSTAYAEVCWGRKGVRMDDYEVLANFDGDWVKYKGDNIPALALEAGRSDDNFPLYIGRTSYHGSIIVGKVQPNYKTLSIPYDGSEVAFKEFEILCHKPPGLSTIPHPLPLDQVDMIKQDVKWVYSCHGRIPRNAFVIGYQDGRSLVLIRVKLFGYWYPGWLCSGESIPHVFASDNRELEEYEVLCDFKGYWEKAVNFSVLKNALTLDMTHGTENVYVGRFWHQGDLICGPIRCTQPNEKLVCIAFHKTDLIAEENFEILCYPNEVFSTTKNGLKNLSWDL
ncbi:unnamed protein product [Ceutorhynchus assimilis]|uniref:Farnesoic acid O-methyl transferase domain-containing protein n=1 Tax=Ceutorhynchus assimilis TaxID=467358 RepID=A0A9N9QGG9_9CUCU|nr:unnamed protein product [Ceutorhynchus assimilis]